jgi:hypothetical protein
VFWRFPLVEKLRVFFEEHIETTDHMNSIPFDELLVSIRRASTAYSTNGLPVEQSVRRLKSLQTL